MTDCSEQLRYKRKGEGHNEVEELLLRTMLWLFRISRLSGSRSSGTR